MRLILTVPAYADFTQIAQLPTVESVRLNTTLKIDKPLREVLSDISAKACEKEVWIDLKCRQLRIADYITNWLTDHEEHYFTLSHNLSVRTPTTAYFDNANYSGKVEQVLKGDTIKVSGSIEQENGLHIPEGERLWIRPGMSVNILDPSLRIDGYLTERDRDYISAAKTVGLHNYMLSFVEEEKDITDVLRLDSNAKITAKIESKKGMGFVEDIFPKYKGKIHLMAARGDLYTELERPDQIIDACKKIIAADPDAIFASRLLESLRDVERIPKCQDITDLYSGMQMGYKRFMLGDDVCSRKDSVESAIGLFNAISNRFEAK